MTCISKLEGYIDTYNSEKIAGWAWDKDKPNTPIDVDIYDSDSFLARVTANIFRSDLLSAGMGDGRHGFTYIIPRSLKDGKIHLFRVKFAGTNVELTIFTSTDSKEEISQLNETIEILDDMQLALIELLTEKGVLTYKEWDNKICTKIPIESLALLWNRREILTPPRSMDFIGSVDFKEYGREHLRYFIDLGDLKPNERVLDIGCGIGRMAVPLTKYLDTSGSYEGFDIVSTGIDWCRKKITSKYPNFRFYLADVFNKTYNPQGKCMASEYKFPYANESFDFVFLVSIFTHMLPQDMENYFSEIVRVLRKNGRCFISFFLLNDESNQLIYKKKSTQDFKYNMDGYHTINKDVHENLVAYDEQYIRGLYYKYGLRITEPIHYGSWCGRSNYLSYQDIILSEKQIIVQELPYS